MISSVYAACSDGTAATGFAYSDPRSYSPSNEKARNGHVAGDRADQPRRRVELAHPAREPGRRSGEEREGDERHPGEERDAGDVAAEAVAGEEPEQPGDEIRRDEVAHVDGPGREVVPAQVRRPVPEPLLQPDRRDGAAEEKGVGLELRPVPGREEQAVGVAAQQVVDREHERERQPLEHDAAHPAHEIGRREREQAEHDPDEQPLAPDGNALAPHVRAQREDVESRRDPADRLRRGKPDLHAPRLSRRGGGPWLRPTGSSCRAGTGSRARASSAGGRRRSSGRRPRRTAARRRRPWPRRAHRNPAGPRRRRRSRRRSG